jgi:DNA-binding NarL/FixJ family response regulator
MNMRILLADGNAAVRKALRLVLEQQEGWAIIGEAWDTVSLFALAARDCADVVLLDMDLPGLQSARPLTHSSIAFLIETLHRKCPSIRVIALSSRPNAETECLQAKANAFVCKSDPPDHLLAILDCFSSKNCV